MTEILNVFGIDFRVLILQAVNFGIVLVVLWYFLYRPLITLIEKRRKDTIEAVANAERASAELAEADTMRKEIVTRANIEAEGIVTSARQSAKETEAKLVSDAQTRTDLMLAEAKTQAEEAKKKAIAESQGEVAKLVVLGVEKMLRERTQ
jgi:F-type H+-transporting ATPase subunit b